MGSILRIWDWTLAGKTSKSARNFPEAKKISIVIPYHPCIGTFTYTFTIKMNEIGEHTIHGWYGNLIHSNVVKMNAINIASLNRHELNEFNSVVMWGVDCHQSTSCLRRTGQKPRHAHTFRAFLDIFQQESWRSKSQKSRGLEPKSLDCS